jgi:aryl-alcohol dehydrogenase-like predicted oxidoreductase
MSTICQGAVIPGAARIAARQRGRRATRSPTSSTTRTATSPRDVEAEVLPTLRALGIGLVAYGVLSRGLLSGRLTTGTGMAPGDFRTHLPRFEGENLSRNLALVEALKAIAAEKGATPAQLAIAWVLAQGPDIIPIVGARRRGQLTETLAAADIALSQEELARLAAAVPHDAVVGTRYAAAQMAALNR